MAQDDGRNELSAPARWDRVAQALAARPRRRIIISLLDAPDERRIPMPDAAMSPDDPMHATDLELELRHHHLPMMSEAGYVRWESERFCVQRGPNFDEAGALMKLILESTGRFPERMIDGCELLEQRVE